jgi:RNA polymerase sigma factor (sigma-70 family)
MHDIETLSLRCRKACYAAFRGLPYDDIEDALQESLIEVWQSLSERPENTQAWFVQRSVYYARTYLRDRIFRHNNRQTVLDTASDDDEEGYGFHPSTIETGFEQIEAESILQRLPVQTRKIAALLAEGYSQEQAAHLIGVSRDTVKRRLAEARNVLSAPVVQTTMAL